MKKKETDTDKLNRKIREDWEGQKIAYEHSSYEKAPKRGSSGSINRINQDKIKKKIDKIQRGNEFTKENLAELKRLKREYKG